MSQGNYFFLAMGFLAAGFLAAGFVAFFFSDTDFHLRPVLLVNGCCRLSVGKIFLADQFFYLHRRFLRIFPSTNSGFTSTVSSLWLATLNLLQ